MIGTVLIVDEDVNAQIIAATLLRIRGMDVRVATDGAAAADIVRGEDVALIVLDLSVAEANGLETLRQLRGRLGTPGRLIEPRIVLVGKRPELDAERLARHLGVDAFLRKPILPGEFIATVEGLLAGVGPQTTLGEASA